MFGKVFVGKNAPSFKTKAVVNEEFKEVTLESLSDGKWLVLFFYPLDFTFVCPSEIIAFSDRMEEFKERNCNVATISTDSVYSHLAWIQTPRKEGGLGQMNIPVLSDNTMQISKDYGVLIEDQGIALRGLFIIDPTLKVRQVTINDLPIGRSVTETLRLVDALQFVEKYGEVCPVDWRKGDDTIDPKDKKKFFSKHYD